MTFIQKKSNKIETVKLIFNLMNIFNAFASGLCLSIALKAFVSERHGLGILNLFFKYY